MGVSSCVCLGTEIIKGDIGGFKHDDLSKPSFGFTNPIWGTTNSIDYAGNKPAKVVRVANGDSGSSPQLATSVDGGDTWAPSTAVPTAGGYSGGNVAYSADGDILLWSTSGQGVVKSVNGTTFAPVVGIPAGAVVATDKVRILWGCLVDLTLSICTGQWQSSLRCVWIYILYDPRRWRDLDDDDSGQHHVPQLDRSQSF